MFELSAFLKIKIQLCWKKGSDRPKARLLAGLFIKKEAQITQRRSAPQEGH